MLRLLITGRLRTPRHPLPLQRELGIWVCQGVCSGFRCVPFPGSPCTVRGLGFGAVCPGAAVFVSCLCLLTSWGHPEEGMAVMVHLQASQPRMDAGSRALPQPGR